MAGSLTTLAAITKKFYVENKVHDQLNQDSYLFDRLAKPAKKEVRGAEQKLILLESTEDRLSPAT